MSQPWKLLPLAAIVVAVGALLLMPGGAARPASVSAELDCDFEATLVIEIEDIDTNDPVEFNGIEVQVDPDPFDLSSNEEFVDGGDDDQDSDPGTIELDDICGDDGEGEAGQYTVSFEPLPEIFEDCDIETDDVTVDAPDDGDTAEVTLELDCEDNEFETPTPEATATSEVGPAEEVVVDPSPDEVNCNGTSIVTISVRDEDGDPVAAGTAVQIAASFGSVSPSQGTTSGNGSAFTFYTAPSDEGGDATITAEAGGASGQATIEVNCAEATATTAPPPTVSPGTISPPNTGDAGLADSESWQPFAALAVLAGAVIGAAAIIRIRA